MDLTHLDQLRINRISELLDTATQQSMNLGDQENEVHEAKVWKTCLDGIFQELCTIMSPKELELHKKWKWETDKFLLSYPPEHYQDIDKYFYAPLEEWDKKLRRTLVRHKIMNMLDGHKIARGEQDGPTFVFKKAEAGTEHPADNTGTHKRDS